MCYRFKQIQNFNLDIVNKYLSENVLTGKLLICDALPFD